MTLKALAEHNVNMNIKVSFGELDDKGKHATNSCGLFGGIYIAQKHKKKKRKLVVRLQEIPSGSVYKSSSKNRANLSLVFGHFCQCDNKWFVHDFYIQAQGGCKMCLSAVKLDHSGKLFWDTPADWVHGYLYFEPGAWIWTKGFRRYLHIVKKWSGKFSLNSSRVRALGWPLLGFFSGLLWFF